MIAMQVSVWVVAVRVAPDAMKKLCSPPREDFSAGRSLLSRAA